MAEPETPKTLKSLLYTEERDIFLIRNNGEQVPLSELAGKTVGFYFSAHHCPPCRAFTPKLINAYNKLKQNGEAFEIVFLSTDRDQEAFKHYHASMPWLALPSGDKLKTDIIEYFHIKRIPSLIIVGPDGETVTTDGNVIVSLHGAKAYPFTNACVAKHDKELEAAVEKYPKQIMHSLHEHSLESSRREKFICNGCEELGFVWSFHCQACDFDLHLECALKDFGGNEKQQKQK